MIYEKSCGAIIYSEKDGKRYYLVEHMLQGHHSFCKGHVERDETEHQTAAREIMEETGLSVEFVDGFRECIEYSPYKECIKTVVFFLARAKGTDVIVQKEEVNDIIWLVFENAMTTLTFDSDRETLQKAEDFLQKLNEEAAPVQKLNGEAAPVQKMMTLSKEDGRLFYRLWIPLLAFADGILSAKNKRDRFLTVAPFEHEAVRKVADELWKNTDIIDLYLDENSDLQEEHKSILLSWKRRVRGDFILVKYLKDGAVFVSADGKEVYLVKGIVSSWKEMVRETPLPTVIEATFIPFRDVIISDGVIVPHFITLKGQLKQTVKDKYKEAKMNDQIRRSL